MEGFRRAYCLPSFLVSVALVENESVAINDSESKVVEPEKLVCEGRQTGDGKTMDVYRTDCTIEPLLF